MVYVLRWKPLSSELALKEQTRVLSQEPFSRLHGEKSDADAVVPEKKRELGVLKDRCEEELSGLRSAVASAESGRRVSKARAKEIKMRKELADALKGELNITIRGRDKPKEQLRKFGERDMDVKMASDRLALYSGCFIGLLHDYRRKLTESLELRFTEYLRAVFNTSESPTWGRRILPGNTVNNALSNLEITYGGLNASAQELTDVAAPSTCLPGARGPLRDLFSS